MTENQVLIISFWNDTVQFPLHGIFIQEQAAAVCNLRENVVFLQVNVLPSDHIYLKKTIEESEYYKNRRIIINLYSRLWKFWYINPWLLASIINSILKKRVNGINPAIIHSNVIFPCGIVGYLLARRMGAELLISEHWSKAAKLLKHPLYKRIALRAYHKSFAIICVSEFLSLRISKATGNKNIATIPNIINTEIFTYLPKPPGDNGPLCMLCVASWKLPKRLDLIFDALCSYALETTRHIDLTVVGNGTQVEMLKNHETPGNLHINWSGSLERQAIAKLLQITHVFLHASNIETFSIVTAEALSTGTPVLASNVGALPELINEQNGLLVENTPDAWLKGIREIVTKHFDYPAIALQNQNKYSASRIGNSIIAFYNRINSDQI
jgi:glycosyltransferase involved in cell wall biosynthesis